MTILAFFVWLTFFATTDYLVVKKNLRSTDIRYLVFCLTATLAMSLFQFYVLEFSLEVRDDLISISAIATALLVFLIAYPKVRNLLKSEQGVI
ncbi:hypothetical protein MKY84_03210 [Chryseomicrobium sp. FSL W7-1435]|uniref:hypothetical protein n=1 Tax=Chryseomicrobium sp. FSL W7-1435 TaxID=2921704 RepID=UPI00315A0167